VAHFCRASDQPPIFLRVPDTGARGQLISPHDAPESFGPGAFSRHGPGAGHLQEETVTVTTDKTENTAVDTADDIDALRVEIDHLDAEILRLVKRRTEVSKRIGRARMAAGGPRIVYSREMAVLARFRELGSEGRDLALLLLRLGRGRLGAGS
jgi:chorismate mutase